MVGVLSQLKSMSKMDIMSSLNRDVIGRSVYEAQLGKSGVLSHLFTRLEQGLLNHRGEFSRLRVSEILIGNEILAC